MQNKYQQPILYRYMKNSCKQKHTIDLTFPSEIWCMTLPLYNQLCTCVHTQRNIHKLATNKKENSCWSLPLTNSFTNICWIHTKTTFFLCREEILTSFNKSTSYVPQTSTCVMQTKYIADILNSFDFYCLM